MSTSTMARVLIVDDTVALRSMVASALTRSGDYEVVGQAGNGQEALELAPLVRPDLVVLDLSMPVMDGVTALPRLRELLPEALIVVFSGFEHAELRPTLTKAGASGFIEKGTPLRKVVKMLTALRAGEDMHEV